MITNPHQTSTNVLQGWLVVWHLCFNFPDLRFIYKVLLGNVATQKTSTYSLRCVLCPLTLLFLESVKNPNLQYLFRFSENILYSIWDSSWQTPWMKKWQHWQSWEVVLWHIDRKWCIIYKIILFTSCWPYLLVLCMHNPRSCNYHPWGGNYSPTVGEKRKHMCEGNYINTSVPNAGVWGCGLVSGPLDTFFFSRVAQGGESKFKLPVLPSMSIRRVLLQTSTTERHFWSLCPSLPQFIPSLVHKFLCTVIN